MKPKITQKQYVGSTKPIKVSFYQCDLMRLRQFNKNIYCPDNSKAVLTERLENIIWLLIKNKLPEFQSKIESKVQKEQDVNYKIDFNNRQIDVITINKIPELKDVRRRFINTYSRFGGEVSELEKNISDIDKQINELKKIESDLLSENRRLRISLDEHDILTVIENRIEEIESNKQEIRFYISKLIKKIIVHSGLTNTYNNIVEIQFADSIKSIYIIIYIKYHVFIFIFFITPIIIIEKIFHIF